MIEWIDLEDELPETCRELVAKNDNKEVLSTSCAKKCKIMKFHSTFSDERIKNVMNEDNITHWAYTDNY